MFNRPNFEIPAPGERRRLPGQHRRAVPLDAVRLQILVLRHQLPTSNSQSLGIGGWELDTARQSRKYVVGRAFTGGSSFGPAINEVETLKRLVYVAAVSLHCGRNHCVEPAVAGRGPVRPPGVMPRRISRPSPTARPADVPVSRWRSARSTGAGNWTWDTSGIAGGPSWTSPTRASRSVLKFVPGPENTWTNPGGPARRHHDHRHGAGGPPVGRLIRPSRTTRASSSGTSRTRLTRRSWASGIRRARHAPHRVSGRPRCLRRGGAPRLPGRTAGHRRHLGPGNPKEVSRWSAPGQHVAAGEKPEEGIQLHGPPMRDGNRLYLDYGLAGMHILDVSDITRPQPVGSLDFTGPFDGGIPVHTIMPIKSRNLVWVNSEAIAEDCKEGLGPCLAGRHHRTRRSPRLLVNHAAAGAAAGRAVRGLLLRRAPASARTTSISSSTIPTWRNRAR